MVRRLELSLLKVAEVRKIPRRAVDNAAGAEAHQHADQSVGLLLVIVVIFVAPASLLARLENLPEIELGKTLDGNPEGNKPETRANPGEKGPLRSQMVPCDGTRVLVDGGPPSEPGEHSGQVYRSVVSSFLKPKSRDGRALQVC